MTVPYLITLEMPTLIGIMVAVTASIHDRSTPGPTVCKNSFNSPGCKFYDVGPGNPFRASVSSSASSTAGRGGGYRLAAS
jgi:hypothetical protein